MAQVYPNPILENQDILNIEFFAPHEEAKIEIFDVLGQKVRAMTLGVSKQEMNTVRINITEFVSGTYLLRIDGIEGFSKFIVDYL